eukprot:3735533-Prymnesium_polylepis.1
MASETIFFCTLTISGVSNSRRTPSSSLLLSTPLATALAPSSVSSRSATTAPTCLLTDDLQLGRARAAELPPNELAGVFE